MTAPRLPDAFAERMRAQTGDGWPDYLAAMRRPPRRSLRVNTLKLAPEEFFRLTGGPLEPNGAVPEGFFAPDALRPQADALHAAGLYYMQEAAAQVPAERLGVQKGDAVLDLCASPGGKAGQIAARLAGTGVLVANEVVAERAHVLVGNLERLGVPNAVVTSMDAELLAQRLPETFDRVLVDAPCSGEGMFRREPEAMAHWSQEAVLACARRQALLLDSAARMLRRGGTLVYSTCTFSEEENEGVVAGFLAGHPEYTLTEQRRLYPHTFPGEGQFFAVLRRAGEGRARVVPAPDARCAPFAEFCRTALNGPPPGCGRVLPDGRVLLLPKLLPEGYERLRIRRAGILAGEMHQGGKTARFEPAHALFLALPAGAFAQCAELAPDEAHSFLCGQSVPCSASFSGFAAAAVSGYPIGFGRASGGTLKSRIPKGLRRSAGCQAQGDLIY